MTTKIATIEQDAKEQKNNLNFMVRLWGELVTRSAERCKDPELMKGVQELLNNYNASHS